MTSARRVAINSISGYFPVTVSVVTGLAVTPILLNELGASGFGLWNLLSAVVGYVAMVELGIGGAVSRFVAVARSEGRIDGLREVLASSACLYAGASALALLVYAAVVTWCGPLLRLAPALWGTTAACLLILGLCQLTRLWAGFQQAVVTGAGGLFKNHLIDGLIILSTAALNVFVVCRGYGVVGLSVVALAITCLSALLTWRVAGAQFKGVRLPRDFRRGVAGRMLRFGIRSSAIAWLGMVCYGLDVLVIGLLLPTSAVAEYAVAAKLTGVIGLVATRPLASLSPLYAEQIARGDREQVFSTFVGATTAAITLALPFVVVVLTFGGPVIHAWVGPGHEQSIQIAAALAVTALLVLPGLVASDLLTAAEKNHCVMAAYAVAAPVNLALSVALTKWFGPAGVALGSLAVVSVVDLIVLPWCCCRRLGFSVRRYVTTVGGAVLRVAVPAMAVGVLMRSCPFATGGSLYLVPAGALIVCGAWGPTLVRVLSVRKRHGLRAAVRNALTGAASPRGTAAVRASVECGGGVA